MTSYAPRHLVLKFFAYLFPIVYLWAIPVYGGTISFHTVVFIYINGGTGINNANTINGLMGAAGFLNTYQTDNTIFYGPVAGPDGHNNVYNNLADANVAANSYQAAGAQTVLFVHGVYSFNPNGTPNAFQGTLGEGPATPVPVATLNSLGAIAPGNLNNMTFYCGMSDPPAIGVDANGVVHIAGAVLDIVVKFKVPLTADQILAEFPPAKNDSLATGTTDGNEDDESTDNSSDDTSDFDDSSSDDDNSDLSGGFDGTLGGFGSSFGGSDGGGGGGSWGGSGE